MAKQQTLGISFSPDNVWILNAVKNAAVSNHLTVAEFVRNVLTEYLNVHGPAQQNLSLAAEVNSIETI